ncbi:MAG: GFA family protein [Alphaproteobacteria bacterium]|nr:GFA family protein [Alphaproteobacteria bacterium]
MPTYHGSCHCGAVRFTIDAEISEIYTCDCSLCRRKSARMTTVHESRLIITEGEDKLNLYQWNARIAKHYFCSVCGIYPFHKKRSMPDHYGVNVACLEDFDASSVPFRAADGKDMPIVDPSARKDWPGPRETG